MAIIITAAMVASPCAVYASDDNSFINFTENGAEIVEMEPIEDASAGEKNSKDAVDDVIWFGYSASPTTGAAAEPLIVQPSKNAAKKAKIATAPFTKTIRNESHKGITAEFVCFDIVLNDCIKDCTLNMSAWKGFRGDCEISIDGEIGSFSPSRNISVPAGTCDVSLLLYGEVPMDNVPDITISGSVPEDEAFLFSSTMSYEAAGDGLYLDEGIEEFRDDEETEKTDLRSGAESKELDGSDVEKTDGGDGQGTDGDEDPDDEQGTDGDEDPDDEQGNDGDEDPDDGQGADGDEDPDDGQGTDGSEDPDGGQGTDGSEDPDDGQGTDGSEDPDDGQGTDGGEDPDDGDDPDAPGGEDEIPAFITMPKMSIDKENLVIRADRSASDSESTPEGGNEPDDGNAAVITIDGLEYIAAQNEGGGETPGDEGGSEDTPGGSDISGEGSGENDTQGNEDDTDNIYDNSRLAFSIMVPEELFAGSVTLPKFDNAVVTGLSANGTDLIINGNTVNVMGSGVIAMTLEIKDTVFPVLQTSPMLVNVSGVIEEESTENDIEVDAVISGAVENNTDSYPMNSVSVKIIKEKEQKQDETGGDGGDNGGDTPGEGDTDTPGDGDEGGGTVDPKPGEEIKPAEEPELPHQTIIDYLPEPVQEFVAEVIDFTKSLLPSSAEDVQVKSSTATATRNSSASTKALLDTAAEKTQTEKREDVVETVHENGYVNEQGGTGMSIEDEINAAAEAHDEIPGGVDDSGKDSVGSGNDPVNTDGSKNDKNNGAAIAVVSSAIAVIAATIAYINGYLPAAFYKKEEKDDTAVENGKDKT